MRKYLITGFICILALGLIFLFLNLIAFNIEQSITQKNQVLSENTSN